MQSLKLPSTLFEKEFLLLLQNLQLYYNCVVITKFTIVLCMLFLVLEFRLNRWRSLKSSLSNKLIVNAAALIS